MLRSSKLNDELSPVVDVSRALVPTRSVADGSRLIPSVKPVKRSWRVIARPSRGRYPWLAKVFTIGQGLRPVQEAISKCTILKLLPLHVALWRVAMQRNLNLTYGHLMTVLARHNHRRQARWRPRARATRETTWKTSCQDGEGLQGWRVHHAHLCRPHGIYQPFEELIPLTCITGQAFLSGGPWTLGLMDSRVASRYDLRSVSEAVAWCNLPVWIIRHHNMAPL